MKEVSDSLQQRLKDVAANSRRQLVTNIQVNAWSEKDVLDTRRMIEYLEKSKFADDFALFLSDKTAEARLKTLRYLGCWKPLQELKAARQQRIIPLFIFALVPGVWFPELLFETSEATITSSTKGFDVKANCLLYDQEERKMKAYNDASCTSLMFSTLHLRSRSFMLNQQTKYKNNKTKRKHADLSKGEEEQFRGAALFVDEDNRFIQECWVRSKDGCSIENVMLVDIPENVEEAWLPKWIAACRHMLPIDQTKNLYVFLWKRRIVDYVLAKSVADQAVHTYRCSYDSCVDAVARVSTLKTSTLSLCHSIQNLCKAYESELADEDLLERLNRLDVDLMRRNLKELQDKGTALMTWLNSYTVQMGDLTLYASYKKFSRGRTLKRWLSERDRKELEALQDVKRQRSTANGELRIEDHTELTMARSTVADKRRKAGRPCNADRVELIRRYRKQVTES